MISRLSPVMLVPMPASEALLIICTTSTGASVGTICPPAPLNACDEASSIVFLRTIPGIPVLVLACVMPPPAACEVIG